MYRSSLSSSLAHQRGRSGAPLAGFAWRAIAGSSLAVSCVTLAIPSRGTAQAVRPRVSAAAGVVGLLHPGDVVRLRIWREPDLSGDFEVDQMGTVVLPKLGPLTVTNQSPDALKAMVVAGYREYLSHPSIDVLFLRRVQVLGAVRTPGLYQVDPTMTLGDALALAGGTTPDGNPNKLILIRDGVTLSRHLSHGALVSESQVRSGDEIFVPERSWISRNPGIVATVITASVSLFIALRH